MATEPLTKPDDEPEGSPRPQPVPRSVRLLRERTRRAMEGGGANRVLAQKTKGKLTARERLRALLDEGSFQEFDLFVATRCREFGLADKPLPGDGVITGTGTIDGRDVCVFAQDFTVLGGSLGLAHAQKICKIMDLAYDSRIPLIGLLDSGGARIQEGVDSLDGYAQIFRRNVKCSGVIPQISLILGPCAGGAVYSPALTDFVFMVEGTSHMFVTGPEVVKAATAENVGFDSLGGAQVHAARSGVCHFVAKSELDCFQQLRTLLSYLPQSRWEHPPRRDDFEPAPSDAPLLERFCDVDARKPYRIHDLIGEIADAQQFLEVQADFARNIVVGFVRMDGEVAGIVANNPAHLAGALDIDAADKAARFIRFLNAFNLPIVTLVDVPGYWPGLQQEHGGIIRHGAKLLYAYAEATVPKVTVVLRKAYGGAYIAMSSKHLGGDVNFCLPSAEIAVMGPKGAVEILYSREIDRAPSLHEGETLKTKLCQDYADRFASPYLSASTGSIDEVIEPGQIRPRIIRTLRFLAQKRRPGVEDNGGNIPL